MSKTFQTSIRIPDYLADELKADAEEKGYSLSKIIVDRIIKDQQDQIISNEVKTEVERLQMLIFNLGLGVITIKGSIDDRIDILTEMIGLSDRSETLKKVMEKRLMGAYGDL